MRRFSPWRFFRGPRAPFPVPAGGSLSLGARSSAVTRGQANMRIPIFVVILCAAILVLSDLTGLNKAAQRHRLHAQQLRELQSPRRHQQQQQRGKGRRGELLSAFPEATLGVPDQDTQSDKKADVTSVAQGAQTQDPGDVNGMRAGNSLQVDASSDSLYRYEKPGLPWQPTPVVYRGAPWRRTVGTWLERCDGGATKADFPETFPDVGCPGQCSGQGTCDSSVGQCRCRKGYNGSDCTGLQDNPCNMPPLPGYPMGGHIQTICSAECDHRTAMCHCGEKSPYPSRPVIQPCGFPLNEWGGVDVTRLDPEQLWSTDPAAVGWCMADPGQVEGGQQKLRAPCPAHRDGSWGLLGQEPSPAFCINQCTGPQYGRCDNGFCVCNPGWYGVDCSIPKPSALATQELKHPPWLRLSELGQATGGVLPQAPRKQQRPLIYVYDLPSKYTTGLLEFRFHRGNCVSRLFGPSNVSEHNDGYMYGSEMMVLEGLLSSPHRTNNPEEADFFFVPFLSACLMMQADDNPGLALTRYVKPGQEPVRPNMVADWALEVHRHIKTEYPYWDRNEGRDHIWMFLFDEGACYAPQAIWNSIMLTHWGNTEAVHKGCQSAWMGDQYQKVPKEKRGDHVCFETEKDIVVPTRKPPSFIPTDLRTRGYDERPLLFYFRGNMGKAYDSGRPEDKYSMGIRQKVAYYFSSTPNKTQHLGELAEPGVVVESGRGTGTYKEKLSSAKFCGVFPGDGFSSRMEDSVLQGCIPVIIQDGVQLTYESFLDYESFAVRILEEDIPNVSSILKSIPETRVRAMLATVQSLLPRFFYRFPLEMYAALEQETTGVPPPWRNSYEDLTGDDALQTIIQILHYKLHNDKWRKSDKVNNKVFGLPENCAIGAAKG